MIRGTISNLAPSPSMELHLLSLFELADRSALQIVLFKYCPKASDKNIFLIAPAPKYFSKAP